MALDWLALELISIDEFKLTPAKLISFFGFLFFTFLLSKLVRRGLRAYSGEQMLTVLLRYTRLGVCCIT